MVLSWNSTGKIGRIGRHLAEKPDVEVTMCLGPMPSDASDFPGGIPAIILYAINPRNIGVWLSRYLLINMVYLNLRYYPRNIRVRLSRYLLKSYTHN